MQFILKCFFSLFSVFFSFVFKGSQLSGRTSWSCQSMSRKHEITKDSSDTTKSLCREVLFIQSVWVSSLWLFLGSNEEKKKNKWGGILSRGWIKHQWELYHLGEITICRNLLHANLSKHEIKKRNKELSMFKECPETNECPGLCLAIKGTSITVCDDIFLLLVKKERKKKRLRKKKKHSTL